MITVKRTTKVIESDNQLPETVTEVIENDNPEDKPNTKKGRNKKDDSI